MYQFLHLGWLLLAISLTGLGFALLHATAWAALLVAERRGWMDSEMAEQVAQSNKLIIIEFGVAAVVTAWCLLALAK